MPMDNSKNGGFATATELRKQLLITQGAMFRSGIVASKDAVRNDLGAESLAKGALKLIGLAAFDAWRSPSSGLASGISTLGPLLVGGISGLWRQPNWKPLVRSAMIAGVVAAATILLKRKKGAAAEAEAEVD
jgi:hypothetical protein